MRMAARISWRPCAFLGRDRLRRGVKDALVYWPQDKHNDPVTGRLDGIGFGTDEHS